MDSGGTGIELDRISSLDDSILCHILSFLPTKLAVGTSILSSRWRYLWVYAPTLIFDDTDISKEWDGLTFEEQEELYVTFADFVNRVLHFSKLQPLQKFHLSCACVDYLYIHIDILHSWIDAAISRNVQIMYICLHLGDPVDLPLSSYISETLVELTLDFGFLPFPASVWLPSVKALKLQEVLYENDETAQVLYSGCPVLERLRIVRNFDFDCRQSLNVSVPSVKWLGLVNDTLDADFLNEEEPKHLNINAPNMECFRLSDNISDDFTLANVSSSLQANVSVSKDCKTLDRFSRYLGNLYNLLIGIAQVTTLTLSIL